MPLAPTAPTATLVIPESLGILAAIAAVAAAIAGLLGKFTLDEFEKQDRERDKNLVRPLTEGSQGTTQIAPSSLGQPAGYVGGTDDSVFWYADDQQIIEVAISPYLQTVGVMVVEAWRFYRFRGVNSGSSMELQIEFDTDEVRNVNQPEDKFTIFTHGAITGGTMGTLDFSGVSGLWRIYAVWLDMTGAGTDDSMEITINNGGNVTAYWDLPLEQVPWTPPANIVGAANTIFIRPTADVANVVLYAKEAELDGVVAV